LSRALNIFSVSAEVTGARASDAPGDRIESSFEVSPCIQQDSEINAGARKPSNDSSKDRERPRSSTRFGVHVNAAEGSEGSEGARETRDRQHHNLEGSHPPRGHERREAYDYRATPVPRVTLCHCGFISAAERDGRPRGASPLAPPLAVPFLVPYVLSREREDAGEPPRERERESTLITRSVLTSALRSSRHESDCESPE